MTNQQGAPEAPKGTASDGKTELFNVPGYPLMVRAADFNRLHAESERLTALVEAQQPAPSAAGAVEWIGVSSHHLFQRDGILGKAGDVVTARWPVLPQPSPTPQADSQPAPVPDWLPFSKRTQIADRHGVKVTAEFNALVRDVIQTYLETHADRAASAPTDSVTAPAGGLGWKLVPMEITDAMRNAAAQAGMEALDLRDAGASNVGLVPKMYEAMLAAAPTPPAQAADSVTAPAGESRCANCGKSAADSRERIADYPEEGEWFCSAQCKDQHDELDCPHLTHNGYRHPAESERLIACEGVLRSLASWLGVGGFNAPTVDAKVFEEKIRWGIEHLLQAAPTPPAQAADSVLEDAALSQAARDVLAERAV